MFHASLVTIELPPSTARENGSFWLAWQDYEDIMEPFVHLAGHPFELLDIDDDRFQKLERLIVILYDKPVH